MRKELEISAKFDTSDFDKAVERMQKRLKEIYAPADMIRAQTATNQRMQQAGLGGAGPYSAGSSSGYRAATQASQREVEQAIQKQVAAQERMAKVIMQREELMKRMESRQSKMIEGSKEELRIREQINRMEENQLRLKETYKQRDMTINQMIDQRERTKKNQGFTPEGFDLMRRFAQQGMYGASARQMGRMMGANPMGTFGGAMGGLGAAAGMAGGAADLYGRIASFPMRLEEARGNAIGQTTGRDLASVYGGRSPFEAAYLPERKAAAGTAADQAARNRIVDRTKGIASVGGMVAGAGLVAGGLAVGGASLLGAPFTAGGSALGLPVAGSMIAGGAAMFGGGAYGMSNDRNRKGILGGKEYEQLIASQQAKDFRETLENLKQQDPKKKLVLERYEQDRMRDVGTQRGLGLNDFEMYGGGGFQARAHRAGFMSEQAAGMASNIIGAGGSARMGRQAEFGLGMERAGLTNAGGILGSLSGSIQSPEATKRATIGIMAEAFQVGLDNTDFAEENRRFTQAAAQVIGRSGASSEADQDKIARTLGQFLGERTNKGVESAQGAYERYQQRGSQLGGRRGAQRLSAGMQDSVLKKFSTQDLTELLGARPDQLRSDSAFLQSYAVEAGVSPEELSKRIQEVNKKSRFLIPGRQKEVERLSSNVNKYMQDNKMSYQQLVEASRNGKLPPQIAKDFGMIQRRISQEESGGFETSNIEAQAGEFLPGFQGQGGQQKPIGDQKAKAEQMITNVGDKLADKIQAKGAEGEDEGRKALRGMAEELGTAATNASSFSIAAAKAATVLNNIAANRTPTLSQGNQMGLDIGGVASLLDPGVSAPQNTVQVQATKDSK